MNAQPSELLTGMIATLDIGDFEDVPSGTLVILHPKTQAPTPNKLFLAGPEHADRKKIDMARTRKIRSEFAATGKMPVTDPIEEYEEQTDYLVTSTTGWELTLNGQPMEFSQAAARTLYTDPKRQWLRRQALVGLQKTEIFISASAKS